MPDDLFELVSRTRVSRRGFIVAGSAAAAAVSLPRAVAAEPRAVDGRHPVLDATQTGGVDLKIAREKVRIGGEITDAITINGTMPGPVIRLREGTRAKLRVHNHMEESTSIHWHGMIVPYTMDGVPGLSFEGIAPGETFEYEFLVRQSGTYWYHSHSGLQEQSGHYGQLIVEPAAADPVAYDVEHSIVLSDWTFADPHTVMRNLKTIEGYYNFQRPTLANLWKGESVGTALKSRWQWNWMRMDPTDISDVTGATYTYLMNGRTADENPTFLASEGQRVRLRIVNSSAMTYFDFRIPGLSMTVVQADGQNVEPVEVGELRIAVAETYDVIVTLPDDRAYTLFAETMDRSGFVRGTLASVLGSAASVPKRRSPPMLTMADMGMMHGRESMDGMAMREGGSMPGHDMGGMDEPGHSHLATMHAPSSMPPKGVLPITDLPSSRQHDGDNHGPTNASVAHHAYRQLDDPGPGLGQDGWRVLTYDKLRALRPFVGRRPPTREIDMHLTGNMHKYIWGFDGKPWSGSEILQFVYGERLRINFINDTMMNHPIHLHGMWMDLWAGHEYAKNPRKHTVNVQPAELVTVDIDVDAPGKWAFHCHLLYHMEGGMFRTVAVVRQLDERRANAHH